MEPFITSAVYSNNPITMLNHDHNCSQLIYVVRGHVDFQVGKHCYHTSAGKIALSSRLEQHSVVYSSPDYERYIIQVRPFSSAEISRQYKLYSLLFNRPNGFSNIIDLGFYQSDAEQIFRKMVTEVEHRNAMRTEMLNLLLQELLLLIYRQEPLAFSPDHEKYFNVVAQIQNRFETDLHQSFSLAALSHEYGLSASYLSHVFKEISGSSIMGYLTSCRIAAAKTYLANSPLSVNEIVELCGFSDASNFSRTFKKLVGCSPSQFRKQHSNSDG